jgi:hypothetical protein
MGLCCNVVICGFSRYAATGWFGDGVIPKFSRYVITAGGGCATWLCCKLVISRFRRYAATRRQMAFPALDEVLAVVALGHSGWAGAVVTAADAEGVQQAGHAGGVQWLALVPFVPGTVLKVVKMIEDGGCG